MTASFEPWLFAPPFAVYEGLETNGQTTSGDLKATSRRKRLRKMSILLVYHNSQAIIQPIFKTIARPPKKSTWSDHIYYRELLVMDRTLYWTSNLTGWTPNSLKLRFVRNESNSIEVVQICKNLILSPFERRFVYQNRTRYETNWTLQTSQTLNHRTWFNTIEWIQ